MEIDEGVLEREGLGHAGQGVVDGRVAVGVEPGHHVAHNPSALHVAPVGPEALVIHRPKDPAVHRLESVTGVGQSPADDDRHGVVQERALHLLLDLDDGDASALDGREVSGVAPCSVCRVAH